MIQTSQVFSLFLVVGLFFSCAEKRDTVKSTIDAQINKKGELYNQQENSVYVTRDIEVYNDVLNDLIKNHFYFYYLGKNSDKIYKGYDGSNLPDTVLFNKRQKELTNKLLANPDQLCTLYINLSQEVRSLTFDFDFGENKEFEKKVNAMLNKVDGSSSDKIKYLSVRQQLFNETNFHSNIAKITAIRNNLRARNFSLDETRRNVNNCAIGIVSLSNIILDKNKKRGVVYYEFRCGGKCGRGELAEIEKIQGKWQIVHTIMFWIS